MTTDSQNAPTPMNVEDIGSSLSMPTRTSISIELNLFPQCAGSSRWEQESDDVICSVYGPGEVKVQKEITEKATVVVEMRPAVGPTTLREAYATRIINGIFEAAIVTELHPRTQILLQIQRVTRADPCARASSLCTMVNCLTLALLDAAMPLHFTPVAIATASNRLMVVVKPPSELNPASIQSLHYAANMTADACQEQDESVSHITPLTLTELKEAMDSAISSTADILELYKRTLADRFLTSI